MKMLMLIWLHHTDLWPPPIYSGRPKTATVPSTRDASKEPWWRTSWRRVDSGEGRQYAVVCTACCRCASSMGVAFNERPFRYRDIEVMTRVRRAEHLDLL